MKNGKMYLLFWLSQSISQLGSAMTSFALVLWTYERHHSAMAVSAMSFCSYVPFVLVSLMAGAVVDKRPKKAIMLIADSTAALCSLAALGLWAGGRLQVWHIYVACAVVGTANAFQQPAAAVAVGRLVPRDKLARASGLNSFSANLTTVLSPVLSALAFSAGGLGLVLAVDLASFLAAFFVLLLAIRIPEDGSKGGKTGTGPGVAEGLRFLKGERGIFLIMVTMAVINFFSNLTYENILSPMILARSGGSSRTLGMVNAAMGAAGILGGIIVSLRKSGGGGTRQIYGLAAVSFLLGDIAMAVGRSGWAWSAAGIAASLPIPFILAAQNEILYRRIPADMQGRVFAVRNALQFGTIPVGILLGGALADYVFEPMMQGGGALSAALAMLVGRGEGSGMAVMFLVTGTAGFLISSISGRLRAIRDLDEPSPADPAAQHAQAE